MFVPANVEIKLANRKPQELAGPPAWRHGRLPEHLPGRYTDTMTYSNIGSIGSTMRRFVACSALIAGILQLALTPQASAAGPAGKPEIILPVVADSLEYRQIRYAFELAYKALGIRVRYVTMPPQRALFESNAGHVDGEVARNPVIEPSCPNLRKVEVPIFLYSFSAVVLKTSKVAPASLQDLSTMARVGIIHGRKKSEEATRGWPNAIRINNDVSAIRMLRAGRVDALLIGTQVALTALRDEGLNEDDFVFHELFSIPLFHYLHKNNAALIPAIGAELSRLKGKQDTVLDGVRAQASADMPR